MLDLELLSDGMATIVREQVARAVAQLRDEATAMRIDLGGQVAELRGFVKALPTTQQPALPLATQDDGAVRAEMEQLRLSVKTMAEATGRTEAVVTKWLAEAENLSHEALEAKEMAETIRSELEALKSAPPQEVLPDTRQIQAAVEKLAEQARALAEAHDKSIESTQAAMESLKSAIPTPVEPDPEVKASIERLAEEAKALRAELAAAGIEITRLREELDAVKSIEPPADPTPALEKEIGIAKSEIEMLRQGLFQATRMAERVTEDVKSLKDLPPPEPPEVPVEAIREAVAQAMKALPPPKNGEDGKSVTIDDVAPIAEGYWARWSLEFERRGIDMVTRALEKIPLPSNGRDGLSLEDFKAHMKDDGRTIVLSVMHGDFEKSVELRIDAMTYQGSFVDGEVYEKGHAVTRDGSLWSALVDGPQGIPGQSRDWKLAVKKGRDGKDGDKGDPGKKGQDGKDLRVWPYVPDSGPNGAGS